jgi:hypothetical protein
MEPQWLDVSPPASMVLRPTRIGHADAPPRSNGVTLRSWAIKSGELKPLARAGLLCLGARCAMRVEPWLPPDTRALWSRGLEHVVASAFAATESGAADDLRRDLSDRGAAACNALTATDEPLGRCMNYATQALVRAIDATHLDGQAPLKKAIIEAAKLSTAIAGVLAHAGRVVDVPVGATAADVACVAMWDAIRSDMRLLAHTNPALEGAEDRVLALRECSPLWVGAVPRWVTAQQKGAHR